MRLIVGLDISTSTIGWAGLFVENKQIKNVVYGYYKPLKNKDDKINFLLQTKKDILNLIKNLIIKDQIIDDIKICVEDILLFTKNTTATTVTSLAAINRVLCVSLYEDYNNVSLLPVQTIRAKLRRVVNSEITISKELVPETVEKIIKKYDSNWAFEYQLNKKGKMIIENYDKADGIAVALSFAYINNYLEDSNDKKRSGKTTRTK
ncbi:MAG: hypothetical protein ACOYMA_00220 [Bacteroidia bacterium]